MNVNSIDINQISFSKWKHNLTFTEDVLMFITIRRDTSCRHIEVGRHFDRSIRGGNSLEVSIRTMLATGLHATDNVDKNVSAPLH